MLDPFFESLGMESNSTVEEFYKFAGQIVLVIEGGHGSTRVAVPWRWDMDGWSRGS